MSDCTHDCSSCGESCGERTAPALTPRPGGETKGTAGRPAPGSVSWVPGVAGMILAGEAVKIIAGIAEE